MKKVALLILFVFSFFSFLTMPVSAKSITGNIQDLLKRKQSLKCAYSNKVGKQTLKGTMYIANNRFRSEFKMPLSNKKMQTTYSLSDGKWMYTWSSLNKQGTKINIKQSEKLAKKYQQDQSNKELSQMNKQLKNKYKFQCQNWKVKSSMFKIPKNIAFTDLSKMMEGLQKMGQDLPQKLPDLKQDACSICNSLPEAAKQACLQNCQ